MEIEDEWGEDFLKLMLGEDLKSSVLSSPGHPITTANPHAEVPPPPPPPYSHAKKSYNESMALVAIEKALLAAGPTAINGPFTILASVAVIILRHYVPDKSIKLRDLCHDDPRFVFHAGDTASKSKIRLRTPSKSQTGNLRDATLIAMNTLHHAVSHAGHLAGMEAGLIIRQLVSDMKLKVKDLIIEDGRFEFVHLNPGGTGPASVRLKSLGHPAPPPPPPSPHPTRETMPTSSFLREKATPQWKKLSMGERNSYGSGSKAFFVFAESLWESTGRRDSSWDNKPPYHEGSSSSTFASSQHDADKAREALAQALLQVGQKGWPAPYSLLAGQAGTIAKKFTDKKFALLITERPDLFEWNEMSNQRGSSFCTLTPKGRIFYSQSRPSTDEAISASKTSVDQALNFSNSDLIYGPILSSSDPSFGTLLGALEKSHPTVVGLSCQLTHHDSGSSLFLELAFGGGSRKNYVYRFDLLRSSSVDIQAMLLTLRSLLFEAQGITKVTGNGGKMIERLLPFLPPGTRISPVFDLKVFDALAALPSSAVRVSESLNGSQVHGGISLNSFDSESAQQILEHYRVTAKEPSSSLNSSLGLSLSQLAMDSSATEYRNRIFGKEAPKSDSLLSLQDDQENPGKWVLALMKIALNV